MGREASSSHALSSAAMLQMVARTQRREANRIESVSSDEGVHAQIQYLNRLTSERLVTVA
jgi:cob(I)alamin adenosyltransferase